MIKPPPGPGGYNFWTPYDYLKPKDLFSGKSRAKAVISGCQSRAKAGPTESVVGNSRPGRLNVLGSVALGTDAYFRRAAYYFTL